MDILKYNIIPVILIVYLPIFLILKLMFTNSISDNVWMNITSIINFFVIALYGFLSIAFCKEKFIGIKNIDNVQPEYANNGFDFWKTTVIFTSVLSYIFRSIPIVFTQNFVPFIITCHIIGLALVFYLYHRSKHNYFDKNIDDEKEISSIFRFFRGLEIHPKLFNIDVKQWTNCRFGMITWQITILLFMYYYFYEIGFNSAILVNVLLQTIYIGKFFYWETGYFNTLDIILDRGGFYICWGCICFVPAFYTFTTYYLINNHPTISHLSSFIILLLGIFFTYKNYEVDHEKEIFKRDGEKSVINGKACTFLEVEYEKDGKIIKSKLLTSGFWGITRHMNYSFEILTSLMWSMCGYEFGIIPFLYLFYIIILLVHRIYRDEEKCKKKYGKYWEKYCNIVKYRLVYGIY